jgi:lipopolysaccharide transport system ATP-binding protein
MNDIVIRVENLGKKYRIKGAKEAAVQRYVALRDVVADKVTGLFKNGKSKIANRSSVEDFWALKNISFDVPRGEVVGIIGRNGAGKTTLLKILSRITEPTEGRVRIKGRVASLLEVGTGFHPELTGRENISLNGAILGMTRAEIKRKFDEIVAFAEVEKFLDTPVKRYSSGMYVRLAFAVAAHLDPDILIVDEVLAVGDAAFQKKCIRKMEDVTSGGASTVLLVSHNMAVVRALCQTVLLLGQGRLVCAGPSKEIVGTYVENLATSALSGLRSREDRRGSGEIRFTKIRYLLNDAVWTETVATGERVSVVLEFEGRSRVSRGTFVCAFYDGAGVCVLSCQSRSSENHDLTLDPPGAAICAFERFPLLPGRYRLNVGLADAAGQIVDEVEGAAAIDVEPGDFFNTGRLPQNNAGRVLVPHRWRVRTGYFMSRYEGDTPS